VLRSPLTKCTSDAENGFLPSPQKLSDAITPDVKALVCVTPNNPTGAVYSNELMEELFDLCVAKKIWLIVDETYRDFLPADAPVPHRLFERENWCSHLIGLYSFSKSFCIPGLRLGAITCGADMVENVSKVMDNLQICAPRPGQIAVAKTMPQIAKWREENRLEIASRRKMLEQVMTDLPGWEIASIGAYFAYVRHPFENMGSIETSAMLAKERGVTCLPGAFFGEGQDSFLRLAFANAGCEILKGLGSRLL